MKSQDMANIELNLSTKKPCFVTERKLVNIQSVAIKKKKTKKPKQKRVDDQIDFRFPIHRDKDWVDEHAQGFQNKQNIDLFKHYMRLFMKNKFRILQVRKERTERRKEHQRIAEREQEELDLFKSKKSSFKIGSKENLDDIGQQKLIKGKVSLFSPRTESSVETKSKGTDRKRLVDFKTNQDLDQEIDLEDNPAAQLKQNLKKDPTGPMPLATKEFILDKYLADMQMFNQVINLYGEADKFSDLQEQWELRKELGEKSPIQQLMERHYNKLRIVNIYDGVKNNLPVDQIHEQTILTVEDIFINQIMQTVSNYGVNALSLPEKVEFKEIVARRTDQLTELKRMSDLNTLTDMKKKFQKLKHKEYQFEKKIKSQQPFFGFSKRENYATSEEELENDQIFKNSNFSHHRHAQSMQVGPLHAQQSSQQTQFSEQQKYEFQKEQDRIKKAYASHKPGLRFQLNLKEEQILQKSTQKLTTLKERQQQIEILQNMLKQEGKYDPKDFPKQYPHIQGKSLNLENYKDLSSIDPILIDSIEQYQNQYLNQYPHLFNNKNGINPQDFILSPRDVFETQNETQISNQYLQQQNTNNNIQNLSHIDHNTINNVTLEDKHHLTSLNNMSQTHLQDTHNNNQGTYDFMNVSAMNNSNNHMMSSSRLPMQMPKKKSKKSFAERMEEEEQKKQQAAINEIRAYYKKQEDELAELKKRIKEQMSPEMKKHMIDQFNQRLQDQNAPFRYKPTHPFFQTSNTNNDPDSLNSTELKSDFINVNGTQSLIQNSSEVQQMSAIMGQSNNQTQNPKSQDTSKTFSIPPLFLNENDVLDLIIEQSQQQGFTQDLEALISTDRDQRKDFNRQKSTSKTDKHYQETLIQERKAQDALQQKMANLMSQINQNLSPQKLKKAVDELETKKIEKKILNDSIINKDLSKISERDQHVFIDDNEDEGYISMDQSRGYRVPKQYTNQDDYHKLYNEAQDEISYEKLENEVNLDQIKQQRANQFQNNFGQMSGLKADDKKVIKNKIATQYQQKPKQDVQHYLVDVKGNKTQQITETDSQGNKKTYSVNDKGKKQIIMEEMGKKFILQGASMIDSESISRASSSNNISSNNNKSQNNRSGFSPDQVERIEILTEIKHIKSRIKVPSSGKILEQLVVEENGKQKETIITDRETNEQQTIQMDENNHQYIVQDGKKIDYQQLEIELEEIISPQLDEITEENGYPTTDRQSQTSFIPQGTVIQTQSNISAELQSIRQELRSLVDSSTYQHLTDDEIEYKMQQEQKELQNALENAKTARELQEIAQKKKELDERQRKVQELIRKQEERKRQQELLKGTKNMQAEVKKQVILEQKRKEESKVRQSKNRQKETSLTANVNLALAAQKGQGIRRKIQLDLYGDESAAEIMKNQISDQQDLDARKMMMDESGSLTKKFRRDHHVRAKKAVLHEEKIEDGDLDPDLQFMQDMLNQHKKNNTKLFEKIKVVTKKNRKILTGKRLSMTESDEEMKKFQDEMGKRFSLKFPGFFDNEDLLNDISLGKYNSLKEELEQQRQEEEQEQKSLQKSVMKDLFGDKNYEDLTEEDKIKYNEVLKKENIKAKAKKKEKLQMALPLNLYSKDGGKSSRTKKTTTKRKKDTEQSFVSEEIEIEIEEIDQNGNKVKKTVKKKVKKLVSSKKKTKRPTLKLSDELKNSKMMNVQEITADDIASGKYTQEEIEQFNKIQEYKKKLEEYSDTNTTDLTQEITIEQEMLVEEEVEETVIGEDGIARKIMVKKQVLKKVPVKVQVKSGKVKGKAKGKKKKKKKKEKKGSMDGQSDDDSEEDSDDDDDDDDDSDDDDEDLEDENGNKIGKSPKKKKKKKTKRMADSQDSLEYYDENGDMVDSRKSNKYLKLKRKQSRRDDGLSEEERTRRLKEKQALEDQKRKEKEAKLKEQQAIEEEKLKKKLEKERKSKQINNEIEKFKKFNVKHEMERIQNSNLNLKELKQEIEKIIYHMGKKIDPEVAFNVQAYQQRKEQLSQIRQNVEDTERDRLEDKRTDHALQILKNKARLFRNSDKDKILKFSTSIEVPETGDSLLKGLKGKDISAEELKQILKFQQLNDDLVKVLERLVLFKEDCHFLQKLKLMCLEIDSLVVQKSLEQYHADQRGQIEMMESLQRLSFRPSNAGTQYKSVSKNFMSPIQRLNIQRFDKLKQTKDTNPELFDSFVQKCIEVKQNKSDVLKAVNHTISNKSLMKLPEKRSLWDLHQPYQKLMHNASTIKSSKQINSLQNSINLSVLSKSNILQSSKNSVQYNM